MYQKKLKLNENKNHGKKYELTIVLNIFEW